MDSLLCNEVFEENDCDIRNGISFEDCEEAFAGFVAKETAYLPHSAYTKLLQINGFIGYARFKAVTWIIKSQRRMDLCDETIFCAVNYVDRFISLYNQCQGWKGWMFELLSIACLSIATKFNETTAYLLHEFQEDMEIWFSPRLIQRMEIAVLKRLEWRLDAVTPVSYTYLLTQTFNKTLLQQSTQLLLHLLLDPKFLGFHQCVVAISAIKTLLQESSELGSSFAHIDNLVSQDRKDDLIHCERLMRKLRDETICPSSPVTVLKVNSDAVFSIASLGSSRKRKRDEKEEMMG
ncbi:cyclin-D2-2-like [Salvia splendens]|uniref:cyclin-D2-2-like n=1 Tax=Salvia splendens TaxID=180675 RepID=UPI001C260B2D|nr:cyclin-D2-2-like [Salvia splendens]